MRVVFSSYAVLELEDAERYYELQFQGLGLKFRDEVRQAALRISQYPLAWSIETGEVRKFLLHRFPYKLLYSIEVEHLLIIAIAHQHRKPEYWVERV